MKIMAAILKTYYVYVNIVMPLSYVQGVYRMHVFVGYNDDDDDDDDVSPHPPHLCYDLTIVKREREYTTFSISALLIIIHYKNP